MNPMKTAVVESLDQEGRGVARDEGKVMFIDGALTGETVAYSVYRKKPSFNLAQTTQVVRPSFTRVAPRCRYFGVCGGCSMQHLEPGAQVAAKQRILEDNLRHIAKLKPERILPAVHGPYWGYRHRARLSVRHVVKKGGVLVGFHERRSSYVADMESCEVLPPAVSALLKPLRLLVSGLSVRDRLPQIEVAVTERHIVLVLRILEPLNPQDEAMLREFAEEHGVWIWLQPAGPASAHPFHPPAGDGLSYHLSEYAVEIAFGPTQFTQVNPGINQVLVRRAVNLLDPQPGQRVADLFCGLGNFSLPLARRGARVVGYEGNTELIQSARDNAQRNGLGQLAEFIEANLFEADEAWLQVQGRFDKMLIDPPRDGAVGLVKGLGEDAPQRIVYVSCNPATLARDAAVLVHAKGYSLRAAGVVNMFPHTAHVESIALFER